MALDRSSKPPAADLVPGEAHDVDALSTLIDDLRALRQALLEHEARLAPWLAEVDPERRQSAVNLAHYLALRQTDLRPLQERLAQLGLSSLGRSERHVLANLDKVLGLLHRLAGRPWRPPSDDEPADILGGSDRLARHAQSLFGVAPQGRAVRIMVTLPSHAAHDDALVDDLVRAGMDIARINCAHDDAGSWVAMVERVRGASLRWRRPVRVLMDLGGPKLRTGPLAAGPALLKLRPERDELGRLVRPAPLLLQPTGMPVAGAPNCLTADPAWLSRLVAGDRVDLEDARGASRRLDVVERHGDAVWLASSRTVYLTAATTLRLRRKGRLGPGPNEETRLGELPALPGRLHLRRGDRLRLTARTEKTGPLRPGRPATVACTLPQVLPQLRVGERIWFDDGRIGGVVRREGRSRVVVEITDARDGGEPLAADKGINLPDSRLDLPSLTPQDLEDLAVAARHADIVGLSFAQSAHDVRALRGRLVELGAPQVGLLLKIETRRGFERLPEMLLAAMAGPAAGVMIARGDLAVECGYERMAEVQEEMLWACEAAHLPVVWATQVLETLARTGLPSRAEITDAAMGGRAECVMLNKGPHIIEAMRTLDDILRRMQAHQTKKRPLLRALKAWNLAGSAPPGLADLPRKTTSARPRKRRGPGGPARGGR